MRRFLHGAADRLRDLTTGLDDLEPPSALEVDAGELVALLDDYASGLDRLADRVHADDTLRTAYQRNAELVQRLNGAAARATALVTRLQLTGCILS